MKKIFSIILFSMFSAQLHAFEIKSKMTVQANGEFEKFLEITCSDKDNNFCNQLCSNQKNCKVSEVLCEDCVTDGSQLMRSIFTEDVNLTYKADIMFIENAQLMGFLKNRKFMSIPFDLFLNKFSFNRKEILKKEFEKLCYINVENATLLASVNEKNQAEHIVGVICKDTFGSVVLPVNLNPEFTNQQTDFWQILNADIGFKIETLKLKMSTDLNFALKTIEKNNVSADLKILSDIAIEVPADELTKPAICKVIQFSDGTGSRDNDYYNECIKNSIVQKRKTTRRR